MTLKIGWDRPSAGERCTSFFSVTTDSHHRLHPISSLTKAFNPNPAPFQIYAACIEFNGGNVRFLIKFAAFEAIFDSQTMAAGSNPDLHDHLKIKKPSSRPA